jgi:ribose transport system substrate-binding protein
LRPRRVLLLLVLPVLVASCGGATSREATTATTSAADIAAARRQLDQFTRIPRFVPPGPAFTTRSLRGKTIFEIPITSEVPFVQSVEHGMRQAAAVVGVKLVVYPNEGRPSQWAQGIDTAIARKADAITLLAQDPAVLGPQIARAEQAGIPVVVVRTTGEGEPCPRNPHGRPYGSACVPGPFEEAGRLEADWVIAAGKGRGDTLVITSRDARSTAPLLRGLEGELTRHCPACTLHEVDVPIADWAERIRTEVQSALVRWKDIGYVIPIYDSMSQYVVPAILARGSGGRIKIATFNGTPFVLRMLETGDIVEMDAGENLAWLGWAAVDQTLRLLAGVRPVTSEHTPLRVFDDTNVSEAGRPPRPDEGYGNAYVMGYRMLWHAAH